MGVVDPGRMRIVKEESIDSLGVFKDPLNPRSEATGGEALNPPAPIVGAVNLAETDLAKEELEAKAPPKRSRLEIKLMRLENLKRAREERKKKKMLLAISSEQAIDRSAAAQSMARPSGQPMVPSPRQPEKTSAAVRDPRYGALTIYLPDMSRTDMQKVERAIIEARKSIDVYAKSAQTLSMASRGWTCKYCGKPIDDGRWYAREPRMDANSNLISDDVFCSQPCHIQYKIYQQQNGEEANNRYLSVTVGPR